MDSVMKIKKPSVFGLLPYNLGRGHAFCIFKYTLHLKCSSNSFFSEKLSEKAVFFQRLVEERVAIRYSTYKQLIIE